jgi:hypothetical protein
VTLTDPDPFFSHSAQHDPHVLLPDPRRPQVGANSFHRRDVLPEQEHARLLPSEPVYRSERLALSAKTRQHLDEPRRTLSAPPPHVDTRGLSYGKKVLVFKQGGNKLVEQ